MSPGARAAPAAPGGVVGEAGGQGRAAGRAGSARRARACSSARAARWRAGWPARRRRGRSLGGLDDSAEAASAAAAAWAAWLCCDSKRGDAGAQPGDIGRAGAAGGGARGQRRAVWRPPAPRRARSARARRRSSGRRAWAANSRGPKAAMRDAGQDAEQHQRQQRPEARCPAAACGRYAGGVLRRGDLGGALSAACGGSGHGVRSIRFSSAPSRGMDGNSPRRQLGAGQRLDHRLGEAERAQRRRRVGLERALASTSAARGRMQQHGVACDQPGGGLGVQREPARSRRGSAAGPSTPCASSAPTRSPASSAAPGCSTAPAARPRARPMPAARASTSPSADSTAKPAAARRLGRRRAHGEHPQRPLGGEVGEGAHAVGAGEGERRDAGQVDLRRPADRRTASSGATTASWPSARTRSAVASAPGWARVIQIFCRRRHGHASLTFATV